MRSGPVAHLRRRIHKVKLQQILHAKRFEEKHSVCKIGTLDLRNRVFEQFIAVRHFCVQPVAVTTACTARTACPLVRICLRDRGDLQGVHADSRVVYFELRVSRINDKEDAINCGVFLIPTMDNSEYLRVPVRDVSAILVATMTLRRPSAVGSKIFACKSAGI